MQLVQYGKKVKQGPIIYTITRWSENTLYDSETTQHCPCLHTRISSIHLGAFDGADPSVRSDSFVFLLRSERQCTERVGDESRVSRGSRGVSQEQTPVSCVRDRADLGRTATDDSTVPVPPSRGRYRRQCRRFSETIRAHSPNLSSSPSCQTKIPHISILLLRTLALF
jgi:hypothetical protein